MEVVICLLANPPPPPPHPMALLYTVVSSFEGEGGGAGHPGGGGAGHAGGGSARSTTSSLLHKGWVCTGSNCREKIVVRFSQPLKNSIAT